ncbi:SAM-dependent methyltransferase [Nocardia stercoris]|uniref:SAM-dependent methyltransferase n=1 Tax=Nocardia stercoris TaxID=2483361 RepID=A0A3M2LBE5_9NOCA|nr:SAM-dependent methyltransferase [Nocardia stercoris]RMI33265.1 SAM-dependent methyltransferase [Nocardia stercoris]
MESSRAGARHTDDAAVRAGQARPSVARVYNFLLGGSEHYAVDEAYGGYFDQALPGSPRIAVTNRQAVERATHAAARAGIRQFVDFGCGLPTSDNVHQIAQRYDATAHTVYVDHDPIVVAHVRAESDVDDRTAAVHADIRDPEAILDSAEIRDLIDLDEPVALLFSTVLSFLDDADDPAGAVRFWTDRIASGSFVYVSHFRSGGNAQTTALELKVREAFGRGRWRRPDEIAALLAGLDLLDPGWVPCVQWRAGTDDIPEPPTAWEELIVSGLARKR